MMWNEASTSSIATSQQAPMTGLQAKRKREEGDEGLQGLPATKLGPRLGRCWPEARLGRLREPWPPEDDSPPESEDEEDDDEELEELGPRAGKAPTMYRGPYPSCYPGMEPKPYFNGGGEHGAPANYGGGGANYRGAPATAEPYCPPPRFTRTTNSPHHHHQQQQQQQQQQYWPSTQQYCYPSEPQIPQTPQPSSNINSNNNNQTIRCAENGKSYLELGSSPTINTTTKNNNNSNNNNNNHSIKYSRTANYRQQRLAVLNISMCKLSRFRQFPDPSLHRSVLICNTLRRIEREMEHDSQFFCSEPPPTSTTPGPMNYPSPPSYPATPPPQELPHYEHSLRDLASPAPRATPFPSPAHPGSESPDSSGSSINWGSVLSLSSQSDLDPLNNNGGGGSSSLLDDLDSELLPSWRLTPLSADDVLKSVQSESRAVVGEELVDSLMHVLVGT